jgi:hypothetical protein
MKTKIVSFIVCCLIYSNVSAQNFSKTRGFSYKQGVIYSTNGSNWANQQDFFVNEFAFTAQRKVKNNFYLNTAIRGGDRKGYFTNTFATNAITKDTYIEIPVGFKYYTPLSSNNLFLNIGIEGFAGVSARQDRYFDTGTQVPDDYESTIWLSNVNLGFSGEVSIMYSVSEKIWLSCGLSTALDLANFSQNENYQATEFNRRFLSIGVIYVKE